MPERLELRFRFVHAGGGTSSFFAKHGWADDAQIVLDGEAVGYDSITRAVLGAGGRVALHLAPEAVLQRRLRDETPARGLLVVALAGGAAPRLASLVNRHVARRRVALRRAELERAAGGSPFVSAACPACSAETDLTDADPSAIVQCAYCEALWKPGAVAPMAAEGYGVCPECGLWDRVQTHADFQFYFALVVYGWRYRTVRLCDGCAHGLFVRNLLTNLLFLLGVPVALFTKWRSFRGRVPTLAELPRANRKGVRGDLAGAEALYASIDAATGGHPAVAYNRARLRLMQGDGEGARAHLGRALALCPTFGPAQEAVALLEASQGPPTVDGGG